MIASKWPTKDMESKTSLIEARLIAGDKKLFDRLQKVVVSQMCGRA